VAITKTPLTTYPTPPHQFYVSVANAATRSTKVTFQPTLEQPQDHATTPKDLTIMSYDHRQFLDDGNLDPTLMKLYCSATPASLIDQQIPGGYGRLTGTLLRLRLEMEIHRRRNQDRDDELLKRYRKGESSVQIDGYMRGGYERCMNVLAPRHPEIEKEREETQGKMLKADVDK